MFRAEKDLRSFVVSVAINYKIKKYNIATCDHCYISQYEVPCMGDTACMHHHQTLTLSVIRYLQEENTNKRKI